MWYISCFPHLAVDVGGVVVAIDVGSVVIVIDVVIGVGGIVVNIVVGIGGVVVDIVIGVVVISLLSACHVS